jgi:hypothetical protein
VVDFVLARCMATTYISVAAADLVVDREPYRTAVHGGS